MQVSPQARKQDSPLTEYWQARLIECEAESGDYKGFISAAAADELRDGDETDPGWAHLVLTG